MSLFGVVRGLILGNGPLVGELIKLDKEAQREVARGLKYALITVGAGVALLLLILTAGLLKLFF